MDNFFSDVIQRDRRYRSTAIIKDLALLEPRFRGKVAAVMAQAREDGVELVPVETFRSAERQQQVFAAGQSRLRRVGTHHYGLAVDFAKRLEGGLSWAGDWSFMPRYAKQFGLTSLYPGDAGHLQGCTIAQQAALFAGTWYPEGDSVGGLAPLPAIEVPRRDLAPARGALTVRQLDALLVADQVNAKYFARWFLRSSIMAFFEVESQFDPRAMRIEPSGVTSYGLMQVLDTTAAWLGLAGDPAQLLDPEHGVFWGLKYAAWGWNYLLGRLGRPPTLIEWCEGYNEGYGAAAEGLRVKAYSDQWIPARRRWAALLDPV